MTILQALDRYYGRMAARGEAEEPGWSKEPIGFVIVLDGDGIVVDVKSWRDPSGKKPKPERVPKWFGRSGIGSTPFFLWDNSAYALGVSDKDPVKTVRDHAAFRDLHLRALDGVADPGLVALRRFVEDWTPSRFELPFFSEQMFKVNLAFQLDGDRGLIHSRLAVVDLVETLRTTVEEGQRSETIGEAMCLVRGKVLPISRLHGKIKGVDGTASAEVPLVSFEGDAFKSYGHDRGDNAPTSSEAVFRYKTALNALLERGVSRNRLKIGDATVAFWADASDLVPEESAQAAEDSFLSWLDPPPAETGLEKNLEADTQEAAELRDQLEKVAEGRPEEADPKLRKGTRFHVLGLAPNTARLSVRYWLDDDFAAFARRLRDHMGDMRIEPAPQRWGSRGPAIARLLVMTTALQQKFENIPPLLAGEVARAVLAGTRYPRTLLAAAIIRLRAGDDPGTGWHAAIIRGVLERDRRLSTRDKGRSEDDERKIPEVPVSLDREHRNAGYQLGRLFAIYESAQEAALGYDVRSTIRDKYFGAASAAPASIFPIIISNGQHHLSKARKERPGRARLLEKELEEIMDRFSPKMPHTFPRSLRLEDQGEFAIGYYHQRKAKLGDGKIDRPTLDLNPEGDGNDE